MKLVTLIATFGNEAIVKCV